MRTVQTRNTQERRGVFGFITVLGVVFIISCVLLSSMMISDVWGKYYNHTIDNDEAKVAAFVFEATNGASETFALNIGSLTKPGTSVTHTFAVTNKRGETVSEVAQEYNLAVTGLGNLPLVYTLTSDDVTVDGLTAAGDMAAGVEVVHEYTLTIEWPSGETNPAYADIIDLVTVSIDVEQID